MKFETTALQDVLLIQPTLFGDERGFFMEVWNERSFRDAGLDLHFVQDNHSKSRRGTLRGLHYQREQPQGKLVRVLSGAVFDVAVDLRAQSPTFGRWLGVELSAQNKHMLWIPPGFAHGFYVLSPEAEFLYKCTEFYRPQFEVTLRWDDPTLAIRWPLCPGETPLVSPKDAAGIDFADAPTF